MSNEQPDLGAMISGLFGGEGGFDMSKLSGMLAPIMAMVQQSGGLQGLLDKLQSSGLQEQVSSWISQGQNAVANPQQITEALGPDKLKAAAESAGIAPDQLAQEMSTALPNLVDKLTPNGQLPTSPDQIQEMVKNLPGGDQLSGLLGSLFGGNK